MIGAMYQSDQKIVDLYKDVKTLTESNESKISPDEVFNYFEMISVANRSFVKFNKQKLQMAS